MAKRGLWDNIHAKRKRIAQGSGERMRKPGSKGAPTPEALKRSQVTEALADRKQMIAHLQDNGFVPHERSGGSHELFKHPKTGAIASVPRHKTLSPGVVSQLKRIAKGTRNLEEKHVTPSAQDIADKFNMTLEKAVKKIKQGGKVEKEHTDVVAKAKKIARDHLGERPDYYKLLKGLEAKPVKEDCGCEVGTPEYTEKHAKNTPGQRAKKIKELMRKK